jgi:hypothetical protein
MRNGCTTCYLKEQENSHTIQMTELEMEDFSATILTVLWMLRLLVETCYLQQHGNHSQGIWCNQARLLYLQCAWVVEWFPHSQILWEAWNLVRCEWLPKQAFHLQGAYDKVSWWKRLIKVPLVLKYWNSCRANSGTKDGRVWMSRATNSDKATPKTIFSSFFKVRLKSSALWWF